MVLFPNCKVNLGLRVTGKRPDGFHDLETVFYPVALRDALELTTSTVVKENTSPFDFAITGIPIPGDPATNLCKKAWELIKADFPGIAPVRMHLHKAIPAGAGLGGGSSDGATTLQLLNEEFNLQLTTGQLVRYALTLGSDCPFFILNKACYATGRGEKMEEIAVSLEGYYFVIVHAGIHVNTGETFKALERFSVPDDNNSLKKIVARPVSEWKGKLLNDFEVPVFRKYPELQQIKEQLYDAGAVYAAMTGTGSTVYGIFHNSKKTGNLKLNDSYKVYTVNQTS